MEKMRRTAPRGKGKASGCSSGVHGLPIKSRRALKQRKHVGWIASGWVKTGGDCKVPSLWGRIDPVEVSDVSRALEAGSVWQSSRLKEVHVFSRCGWRSTSCAASKKTRAIVLCRRLRSPAHGHTAKWSQN